MASRHLGTQQRGSTKWTGGLHVSLFRCRLGGWYISPANSWTCEAVRRRVRDSFGLMRASGEEYPWSPSTSSSISSPVIYSSPEDDIFAVLASVSEQFDRPPVHKLPLGIRLNTVKTYQPQMSQFNSSRVIREPTTGGPDSVDVCVYYAEDDTEDEEQDTLAVPWDESCTTAADTFLGDVFKTFDESYGSLVNDPMIHRQLQLLQREAPLRRLMKLTRAKVVESPYFEQSARSKYQSGAQYDNAGLSRVPSPSQQLYETPVRSRPRSFHGIPNSPLSFYAPFSLPDTPETLFKGRERDVFDDDNEFIEIHSTEFNKPHRPRLNLVKKFVRRVLASKANPDLSSCSSNGCSEMGLPMDSWASSTGTLSGWTTISMPPSPLHSPMTYV